MMQAYTLALIREGRDRSASVLFALIQSRDGAGGVAFRSRGVRKGLGRYTCQSLDLIVAHVGELVDGTDPFG